MAMPPDRGKRGRKSGPGGRRVAAAEGGRPTPDTEEAPVFPADPVDERRGPISLPSSGLAADILALAGAASVPTVDPSRAPVPVAAAAAEPTPRAHNISFFAAPVREERKFDRAVGKRSVKLSITHNSGQGGAELDVG